MCSPGTPCASSQVANERRKTRLSRSAPMYCFGKPAASRSSRRSSAERGRCGFPLASGIVVLRCGTDVRRHPDDFHSSARRRAVDEVGWIACSTRIGSHLFKILSI
jgi:hypothetical protein